MNFTGNTILITGGTSGIGLELAKAFHAAGNRIIIAGRRQVHLDAITAEFPDFGAYRLDVADAAQVAQFARSVVADHPALNVLVNNAGIMKAENLMAQDVSVVEATVATNLLAPIRLTLALLAHLAAQPQSAILNVTSGLAFVPLVHTPTYNATKAALHSYTQSLRAQLRDTNVRVLEIAPPAVQSDLMPGHATDPNSMPMSDFIAETMQILQREAVPDEVCVDRVMFLRRAEAEGRFAQTFAALNGL